MANGQQIAKENLIKFEKWVDERNLVGDVANYVRGKQLNRSEIANQCGFALSVLRQNPAVKTALMRFEDQLRSKSILPKQDKKKPSSTKLNNKRGSSKQDSQLQELEEKNENLKAKIRELENKLEAESLFERHLFETGRAIKP